MRARHVSFVCSVEMVVSFSHSRFLDLSEFRALRKRVAKLVELEEKERKIQEKMKEMQKVSIFALYGNFMIEWFKLTHIPVTWCRTIVQ